MSALGCVESRCWLSVSAECSVAVPTASSKTGFWTGQSSGAAIGEKRINSKSKSSTRAWRLLKLLAEDSENACRMQYPLSSRVTANLKKPDGSSFHQAQGRKWLFWVFHRTLAAEAGVSWLGALVIGVLFFASLGKDRPLSGGIAVLDACRARDEIFFVQEAASASF